MAESMDVDGTDFPLAGLTEQDAAALDAIVAARGAGTSGHHAPLPPDASERAVRLMALLDLIEQDPVEPAPQDLTQRTLARVQQSRQQLRFAQQVEMLREPRRSLGFEWRQLLSAAAIFLVGFSLLLPVLDRTRADAWRVACAGNLATAGAAFGAYAADSAGVLPRGQVKPGAVWWDVGQSHAHRGDEGEVVRSNSAHLFLLIRSHYASPEALSCPTNPSAGRVDAKDHDWSSPQAVSFSYQNQYTPEPIRLDRQRNLALLADKNPLFIVRGGRIAFNRDASALSSSRSHDRRGQNILLSDGSVAWTVRPIISRGSSTETDNVWTITGVTKYTGREVPTYGGGQVESFLVP